MNEHSTYEQFASAPADAEKKQENGFDLPTIIDKYRELTLAGQKVVRRLLDMDDMSFETAMNDLIKDGRSFPISIGELRFLHGKYQQLETRRPTPEEMVEAIKNLGIPEADKEIKSEESDKANQEAEDGDYSVRLRDGFDLNFHNHKSFCKGIGAGYSWENGLNAIKKKLGVLARYPTSAEARQIIKNLVPNLAEGHSLGIYISNQKETPNQVLLITRAKDGPREFIRETLPGMVPDYLHTEILTVGLRENKDSTVARAA